MKSRIALVAIVALVPAVLLVCTPATPRAYGAGFYLGLATLVARLVAAGGQMFLSLGCGCDTFRTHSGGTNWHDTGDGSVHCQW